eukprot:363998-Chlamydomonas_euryale.AAC.12
MKSSGKPTSQGWYLLAGTQRTHLVIASMPGGCPLTCCAYHLRRARAKEERNGGDGTGAVPWAESGIV